MTDLPALPNLQQFTTQAINNQKNRELLDKAIVGMGAMVDLIERHRAAQPNLMITQKEAMAAESLDLIKAMQGAVERERKRIIVLMRDQAVEWASHHGNTSVASALNSLAMRLEAGQ